jgi:hypothetical protein
MRYAAMLFALAALLACRVHPAAPSPVGLWGWHEPWESAPEWIVKESGPQWSAPAVVIQFCPDGRFRMATGVFYRGGGHVGLGSSDGLALYKGRWSQSADQITVQYRLVDAEIRFTGIEKIMATEITDRPELKGNHLFFTYRRPDNGRAVPMQFVDAASFPDTLDPRFVECSGAKRGTPPE